MEKIVEKSVNCSLGTKKVFFVTFFSTPFLSHFVELEGVTCPRNHYKMLFDFRLISFSSQKAMKLYIVQTSTL